MSCPACDGDRVAFAVPPSLRPYAPDESAAATLCTTCLRVDAFQGDTEQATLPEAVEWDPLPTGDAGVATALLLGLVDSLALRRTAVTALLEHAEEAGGDPFLTLDRLVGMADAGDINPHVDLARRTAQLQSLFD